MTIRNAIHIPFWLFNVSLLMLSLLASWIVLELALPSYIERFGAFERVDIEGLGYRVRPGAMGSNRFGFNDRDYRFEKEPGTYRMLIVGDSFNWPGGQEWNYTRFLEQKFETQFGAHIVDVINVGYPATSTGHQIVMLRRLGLKYHPDLVVLGFFVGNDFIDSDQHFSADGMSAAGMTDASNGVPPFGKRTFSTLDGMARIGRAMLADGFNGGKVLRELPALSEEDFFRFERDRMDICKRRIPANAGYEEQIAGGLQNIVVMRSDVQKSGAEFLLAAYPDEFQVSVPLQKNLASRFSLNLQEYDLGWPQQLLHAFAERADIPFVDMLPRFRSMGSSEDLYIPRNTHWNREGNRLAAQLLFEALMPVVCKKAPPSSPLHLGCAAYRGASHP